MSVPFRIRCCRCGKNIPLAQDIYELDAEWQRRFPDMVGTLACHDCALRTYWTCTGPDGAYVDGHIPAPRHYSAPDCFDALSHVSAPGTHRARVVMSPRSGLLQGAEAYLRSLATRRGVNPETAAEVRAALREWDEQRSCSRRSHQGPIAVPGGRPPADERAAPPGP
ncbi:hypothetical protein OUQ49_33320 (plasmid) [Streptomyces cavourensis]|uniref:hypothetical protein n=1 Tax=Streptomyces cavourensis TaxID=67258 RepID=UPI002278E733|nr:hypothetical protein [Streptomyces cavourensis]WAE70644.1 hypothetical protein OUQ49_33320 [Streptomyces cavourensis]